MLENTGERFIPAEQVGQIKYEHLHRYAVCLGLIAGKTILDIASGEGYGSALLAQVAGAVTGVDVDQAAVAHASEKYARQTNLRYLHGSCTAIPLPDETVDIVTSFETIEHHDQHEEMMQEIKRVLKPGGLLIISSPNKLVYSDLRNSQNPFHVKELYYEGFAALLGRYFRQCSFFGQRLAAGSFIYELAETSTSRPATPLPVFSGDQATLTQRVSPFPLPEPLYFLALASDTAEQVEQALDSLYLDGQEDLLKGFFEMWSAEKSALQHEYAQQIARHVAHEDTLKRHIDEQQQALQELNARLQTIANSKAWKVMQGMWKLRTRLKLGE